MMCICDIRIILVGNSHTIYICIYIYIVNMDYNHDFPSAGMIHIRIHSVCVCARACLLFLLHVISMHIYI